MFQDKCLSFFQLSLKRLKCLSFINYFKRLCYVQVKCYDYEYESKRTFQGFQICFILVRIFHETYCADVVNIILMV